MTIVAFAGPSLTRRDRDRFDGISWRAPAEAGDLLCLDGGPDLTVCLVDGYFDHRPAVRHKEILLLLAEGARVIGSSSIGALRAAEMQGFGMTGVGAIYRAYARGTLVGDDEVALIHGPAERDWRPLSLPLVEVRATLCRARREKVLRRSETRALLNAAVHIHYVDRDWRAVVAAAEGDAGGSAFLAWLPTGHVEQKRLDALDCLRAAFRPAHREHKRPLLVRTPFLDALAGQRGVDIDARCAAASEGQGPGRCSGSE